MIQHPENGCKLHREPLGMFVRDAIARRVSCRAYQPTPVSQAQLMQILEAARLAPSACNQQPWRFVVVRVLDLRRRIVEEGFLPGIKMTWAIDAPVHVVIGMERSFVTHRIAASVSGVNYPWVDIGIAGEHLVLAATELRLGTCWIGWISWSRYAGLLSVACVCAGPCCGRTLLLQGQQGQAGCLSQVWLCAHSTTTTRWLSSRGTASRASPSR